jgi:hypothetical protein
MSSGCIGGPADPRHRLSHAISTEHVTLGT